MRGNVLQPSRIVSSTADPENLVRDLLTKEQYNKSYVNMPRQCREVTNEQDVGYNEKYGWYILTVQYDKGKLDSYTLDWSESSN